MSSPYRQWQANRAAIFDWLVMLLSFFLGFIVPDLGRTIQHPGFYNLMLLALLLYLLGALLKHLPLRYRILKANQKPEPVPYLIFLLIGHWFILFTLMVLAEPAIRKILGMPGLEKGRSANPYLLWAATLLSTWGTWLVYRNKSTRAIRKQYSAVRLERQELLADLLLIGGVAIISFVFWEQGIMAMLSRIDARSIGTLIFLFFFLCVLFVLFYLPLRYLFFMEDREKGRNSRRLFFIFGFLLIKALLEMLRI